MSEEQIIEYLENQDNSVNWNYSTLWAVKGLLNLYNKEKEKNKELKQRILKALYTLDTKPYTAYTFYGDILHENEDVIEILSNKDWADFKYEEYKKELLDED